MHQQHFVVVSSGDDGAWLLLLNYRGTPKIESITRKHVRYRTIIKCYKL
jgi:hypothetical protein